MATVGTVHTAFLNLWSVVVYISSKSSMAIQGTFYSGTTENSGHGLDIFGVPYIVGVRLIVFVI